MTNLALGRLPNDPTKPRVRLRALRGVALTPPPAADWQSAIESWPMLANDRIGDCTAAGAAHIAQAINWYGNERQGSCPSEAEVISMYSAVSGYDPRTGAGDVGATLQDALGYWRQTGVGGNTIAAFAQVNPLDLDLVRNCIAIFGAVYTGFWVPQSALDQFNAGKPWTLVSRSRNVGGHCVPIGAYDATGFECVTWGRRQRMSIDFYTRYFDEVWVPIDLDWLTATGRSPTGLDVATLNSDYMALTGQPGPFAEVSPPPPPPPPPSDANASLVVAFEAWRKVVGA